METDNRSEAMIKWTVREPKVEPVVYRCYLNEQELKEAILLYLETKGLEIPRGRVFVGVDSSRPPRYQEGVTKERKLAWIRIECLSE